MPQARFGKPAIVLASSLLIVACFLAGLLLLAKHDGPPPEPVEAAIPVAVAPPPSPGAVPMPEPVPVDTARRVGPQGPVAVVESDSPYRAGMIFSFDATINDVRVSPEQFSRLDLDTLEKAAGTRESFEKALAALGTSRPLFRASQPATINEEQYIKVINELPSNPAATGRAPSVPARGAGRGIPAGSTGAIFDLIAKPGHASDGEAGLLSLDITITASIPVEMRIAATENALVTRSMEMQTHKPVQPNRPFVLLNGDASILDGNGKAQVFVVRVVLGVPAAASTAPAATR